MRADPRSSGAPLQTGVFPTLLIDNHDSYTYNLVHLCASVFGTPPVVMRHDDPRLEQADWNSVSAIVVSPGPGAPDEPRDVGLVPACVRHSGLPVLGVCLGHQILATESGARVAPSARPVHGQVESITHDGRGLFEGIPNPFRAVRYHSLALDRDDLPAVLEITAEAVDGTPMALVNESAGWWGVQFHPESIASEHGMMIVRNFRRLVEQRAAGRPAAPVIDRSGHEAPVSSGPADDRPSTTRKRLVAARAPSTTDAGPAFAAMFADEHRCFWLDSAAVGDGARVSLFGAAAAAWSSAGETNASLWERLDREQRSVEIENPDEIPFDFVGGLVGWLDYEAGARSVSARPSRHGSQWMRVDRFVAVDHDTDEMWAVALAESDDASSAASADAWVRETLERLTSLERAEPSPRDPHAAADVESLMLDTPGEYLRRIDEAMVQLRAGNSYELCLTTQFQKPVDEDPFTLYRRLRAANPAPYAAYLRIGDLHVLSSSPELFLQQSASRAMQARPMKGTAARSADAATDAAICRSLQSDPKTRAENLMIADLLRNDIGSVAQYGSVTTPRLMSVETFATVHQMVTVVCGRRRPELTPVDAIRACFPPGSMTGAPKERSVEILERLEGRERGIYSGALGYLSHSGASTLSVAIRTAVHADGVVSVGAGGAIVIDSDPDAELREVLTKAGAVLSSIR